MFAEIDYQACPKCHGYIPRQTTKPMLCTTCNGEGMVIKKSHRRIAAIILVLGMLIAIFSMGFLG